ncbi:hypothetical protein FQA39_LY05299 [Lamprigera yunnana]|nr:hypothetical protein FQA39_LY05299 [Lamprigera yunnana]
MCMYYINKYRQYGTPRKFLCGIISYDGKKRLSGAEYCKPAKEKDSKQNDVTKKTRKLDDYFRKVSTDTKDHGIEPRHDVPSGSDATSTDVSSVSSSVGLVIMPPCMHGVHRMRSSRIVKNGIGKG